MEISELTIRLLLLFFPGIIAAYIVDHLTIHKDRDFKVFLLNAFVLGLSSHFVLYIIVGANNFLVRLWHLEPTWKISFLTFLTDDKTKINFHEVFWATVISVVISLLLSLVINYGLATKICRFFKITNKSGALDVWQYVFGSKEVEWVLIRDSSKDLMYEGWIEAFSDSFEYNEIFLREVIVYRYSDSSEVYRVDGLYLTFKKDELHLEFRDLEKRGNNDEGTETTQSNNAS